MSQITSHPFGAAASAGTAIFYEVDSNSGPALYFRLDSKDPSAFRRLFELSMELKQLPGEKKLTNAFIHYRGETSQGPWSVYPYYGEIVQRIIELHPELIFPRQSAENKLATGFSHSNGQATAHFASNSAVKDPSHTYIMHADKNAASFYVLSRENWVETTENYAPRLYLNLRPLIENVKGHEALIGHIYQLLIDNEFPYNLSEDKNSLYITGQQQINRLLAWQNISEKFVNEFRMAALVYNPEKFVKPQDGSNPTTPPPP